MPAHGEFPSVRMRCSVSVKEAVRTLGISHTRYMAVSGSRMRIGPAQTVLDPAGLRGNIRWVAGLMHDFGYVVNLVPLPQQMKTALGKGQQTGAFMAESEYQALRFTHCQTGEVLGRKWNFAEAVLAALAALECGGSSAALSTNFSSQKMSLESL